MTNKYEQLIEFIINDESDKARELFHTIVVEKSRDIYESLIDETDLETTEVQEIADEIAIDEQGISEEEDDAEEPALDVEQPADEEHQEAEIEDRVVDLEDALDELKAEFDALMAGEDHEEHAQPEIHNDEGGEADQSAFMEAEECDTDEEEDKEVEESIVREYVEKAPAPTTAEEGSTNKTTPVAGKNDMGGTAVDVTKGGTSNPDGTSPKATAKPKGELIGKNLSTPGADAGKAFAKKETAVKGEEGAVNATTPVAK